jgi:hypothetical protein
MQGAHHFGVAARRCATFARLVGTHSSISMH